MSNRKLKNNKGFTLIELLAVIVILGVLMIIAVPMVTKYIKQAKQDAFIDTAKNYINSARYGYMNGDYVTAELGNNGTCATLDSGSGGDVYIKFRYIEVDKTGGNSSFNKKINQDKSYVRIHSDSSGKFTYHVYMVDEGGNVLKTTATDSGVDREVEESAIVRGNVQTDSNTSNYGLTSEKEKLACKGLSYDAGA